MAELKTQEHDGDVGAFLAGIPDAQQREDCAVLAALMAKVTRKSARMWGHAMVGFGNYHYRYATGLEGDWFVVGFSPRKGSLSLYIMSGFEPLQDELAQLGKHKLGKACLYIKRLADVDMKMLEALVRKSVQWAGKHQGCGH